MSTSLLLSPSPSPDIPQGSPGSAGLSWLWILLGALGGGLLLFGIIIILIIIVVITVKKKRKSYTINSRSQSAHKRSTSGVSQMKTTKYHRGNSTRSTSINSHVTVGRTESGQHKHMQVVNRGYLLASNEPHTNDRVATQKRPMKPRVALSSKPRKEQDEDYDSDYSEVAITTQATNTTEAQASMSMSIHQNVAYDLDEDDIATVNSVRQAAVIGSLAKEGGVHSQMKKLPAVKAKPKRMASSSSSTFEASVTYDAPKSNRPICLEDSTVSMYDVVRSEYGGELEASSPEGIPRRQSNEPQYSNTTSSIRGSLQDRSEVYYNHRDLELMKNAEVLYGNIKEDSVPDYENVKKESDTSTGEVLYGNLNQDTEENEYYNQRAIMESRVSH